MQEDELVRLISVVTRRKTESQNIEVKSASSGCPTRLFDTLSSFSNQDDGGIILFGIDEEEGFNICGVYDSQDLQKKVTQQCNQMEPVVRALFTATEIEGKTLVAAEIPGADIYQRPVFYKGVGRVKGSYIRVGEADEPMSEYEVYSYEAFRRRIREDIRIPCIASSTFNKKLVKEERVKEYLHSIRKEKSNLDNYITDAEILELMAITKDDKLTLAGWMTFSRYPQTYFPQLCITAVALPGTAMGEVGDEGERFIDNKRITGSISDMVEEAVEFVRKNSRTKTIIDSTGRRIDKMEYPIKAIREAILNALVHRDYSIHTENTPIRIEMYRDRIEIVNSGGLYGNTSIESLGKVRPETRNAVLASILEVLRITENRYSGIPTMRKECMEAGLHQPIFKSLKGEFKVIIYNDYGPNASEDVKFKVDRDYSERAEYKEDYIREGCTREEQAEYIIDVWSNRNSVSIDSLCDDSYRMATHSDNNGNIYGDNYGNKYGNIVGNKYDYVFNKHIYEEDIIEFCKIPRTRAELIAYVGKTRSYVMAEYIQPLVDSGKLTMTLPNKPKSSKQRFVSV